MLIKVKVSQLIPLTLPILILHHLKDTHRQGGTRPRSPTIPRLSAPHSPFHLFFRSNSTSTRRTRFCVIPLSQLQHPSWYTLLLYQITRIKEKVEEQSGVPPQQQRLIFRGRQMSVALSYPRLQKDWLFSRSDDKTANDFNVEAGAVLHLVLALRGGQQA